MSDSPAEYIEELRRQNRILRRELLATVVELEGARREMDRVLLEKYSKQHYTARPGISEID